MPMSVRPTVSSLLAIMAAAAALSACASGPAAGPMMPLEAGAFDAADFAWSTAPGSAAVQGRVEYRPQGVAHTCVGSVGLVPDTPYTRARFQTLYGSTDRAVVPEAVVRARNVPDPNADYRGFTRSTACADNRFALTDLPDGGWFLIVPDAAPNGERQVMMRRVQTRGGPVSISLN